MCACVVLCCCSYAAAKCAITGFASGLWAEVRCSGVLVSTVYPGLVATDMGADFKAEFGSLVDRKLTAEQCVATLTVAERKSPNLCLRGTCAGFCNLLMSPTRCWHW